MVNRKHLLCLLLLLCLHVGNITIVENLGAIQCLSDCIMEEETSLSVLNVAFFIALPKEIVTKIL